MAYLDNEQTFFGRTKPLELLKKRVLDLKEGYRQNVALLGNRYLGKTSVFARFLMNLDDENMVVIYLDLDHKNTDYFVTKYIVSLLYHYSKQKHLELHEDIDLLIENTAKYIPQTVERVRLVQSLYKKGQLLEAFSKVLSLPEIFSNETGLFCVVILDEFQGLEDFVEERIFQDLGKQIMTQRRCLYLVSSSYPSVADKILSEKLSLLFGNFEVIHIDPFDLITSQQFIEFVLREIKIGAQLRNFLTDFTGGHPLYLNLICQELINLSAVHKQDEIYMPILAQAIENTIFNRWGVISRHFELIINELCSGKGNHLHSHILISLANGKNKIEDLLTDTGLKRHVLMQKMTFLLEQGIIVRNGHFHYYKDKLFKYWMKYIYQKRFKEVDLIHDKQRKQFKEEFNHVVDEFKVASRKDFPSRVVELLNCFDDEAFDLNGRKYKLPAFRAMTPFRIKNECGSFIDVVSAVTDDSSWFIILKKDGLNENDINLLLDESKKMGTKPERCLIISLIDLDENARLKALQERFWIWNEHELNTLLTVFDKPFIVR
jgi:hypothetical protein